MLVFMHKLDVRYPISDKSLPSRQCRARCALFDASPSFPILRASPPRAPAEFHDEGYLTGYTRSSGPPFAGHKATASTPVTKRDGGHDRLHRMDAEIFDDCSLTTGLWPPTGSPPGLDF
ncbi:unnamed protein product [Calypogeia fissa]